jgi:TolB protein
MQALIKYFFILFIFALSCNNTDDKLGVFEANADIGNVLIPGDVKFDADNKSYMVSASGYNIWEKKDEFHFVWKKMSGDVSIAAAIKLIGKGTSPHRKACLMIRQSLDSASVYADIAFHGDGLTSIQFRQKQGQTTHEVKTDYKAPEKIKLEKRGEYIFLLVAHGNDKLKMLPDSIKLSFEEPFYVGLGVCSHEKNVLETAEFSNVVIKSL